MKQVDWFASRQFHDAYYCEAPLGAFCSKDGTEIRLWAPTADAVLLHIYPTGDRSPAEETVHMEKGEKGMWRFATVRNLEGKYYDFDVSVGGNTARTADPYARSCGVNGSRSMILDLASTDPEGWQEDKAPAHTPEQVIYELHVKDFSWDISGGFPEQERGKYAALCRRGTTLHTDGIHPTGVDYLKRLGVTHIQLMPVYDYGSVDERTPNEGYNWGYDPVNYNVPEGSYSSDPADGYARVRELKQAVAFLHEQGFRVIMDVVYNHTFQNDSWLERAVPGYYYRRHSDGTPSNGSGCGNDIASERSMCAKYILDSALYWVSEYHMDGFRFDLMGLLDQELMESLQNRLDELYGPGEKLVYGEPWRADNTVLSRPVVLCDKNSLKTISGRIGAFCDDTRDAVKGSLMDLRARGFVNGGGLDAHKLHHCLAGWAGQFGAAQTPYQTISYLSCHDDWTLWDKLVSTLDEKQDYTGCGEDILRANRLAAAFLFCCQGRPFFLAGEEFGRTKGGIKNSYCSSIQVNKLDWDRAWKNRCLVEYYRGLIGLRMQLSGLQDKSQHAARNILWVRQMSDDFAAACVENPGSKWEQTILLFNCSGKTCTCNAPEGTWQVLADGVSSLRWQEQLMAEKILTVPPFAVLIIGKK